MLKPLVVSVCALLLVACRTNGSVAGPSAEPQPLGVAPSSIRPSSSPTGTGSPTVAPTATAEPTTTATATATTRPFHNVGRVLDGSGDGGAQAKPYEDILGIVIQDNGDHARILVRLGATIPNPLPEGEQMGIGVDLYLTPGQPESDYQVFAAGDEEGWLAFFTNPEGPEEFPGAWGLADDILEFTLPWSALGAMQQGVFSGFVDWDRDSIAVNLAGGDRAPDQGRTTFAR